MAVASGEGLKGLSIGDLAKRVGMSKSGLFAHFTSKEELQLEVRRRASGRFADSGGARARGAPGGGPRLRSIFEHWLGGEGAHFQPGGCIFMPPANELDARPGPL